MEDLSFVGVSVLSFPCVAVVAREYARALLFFLLVVLFPATKELFFVRSIPISTEKLLVK